MKKNFSRIGLAFALLLSLQLIHVNAQVRLSVRNLKFQKDTTTFGSNDALSYSVINTGTQAFQGKIYFNYSTNGGTGGSTPLDSTQQLLNFKSKDSLQITTQYFIVEKTQFSLFSNIVVVWPIASGVTSIDSAKTTLFVIDPQTGINEMEKPDNGIILYPNPAYSRLYIMPIDPKISIENVRIYNNIGSLIKTVRSTNNLVDISGLESGLYTLEIETNTNNRITKRFVKE